MRQPASAPKDKAADGREQSAETNDPHGPRRPHALDISIGMALKFRRQVLGLSLQDLAGKCGLSFQQIQKYENGTNRIPASRLFFLASSLKTTPTELLSAAWTKEFADHDIALRERLAHAAGRLSGEQLQALMTLAESLASPAPDADA